MNLINNVFINSSNNISLSFIIITFIFILFFSIFSPLIKFKKIKWKFCSNRNLVFLATLIGLIIGIIYNSFNHFNKATINNLNHNPWLWDMISFVYSFGSLFISLLLLACWFVVPFVGYKTIKKFLLSDYSVIYEIKKLIFVLIFMIITISFSNIAWIFPLNDLSTPLTIFKLNNHLINHDIWFIINKFMFDHCYLTQWYPWVFISYFLINVLIIYIIIKTKIKDQEFLDQLEQKLIKIGFYFHIFDSFGAVSSFCFISCYFLFNFEYMFIHIGYILMILFLCYFLIGILIMVVYGFKFINVTNKWQQPKEILKISFINHFSINKPKHKFKAINISDVTITALAFTIYMGFSYNFDFEQSTYLNEIYNYKMHSFSFWFQVIFSALIFNIISDNRSYNSSLTKLFLSEATYSVTPGLQTGILTWINPLFKPFSNFVNDMVYILVSS